MCVCGGGGGGGGPPPIGGLVLKIFFWENTITNTQDSLWPFPGFSKPSPNPNPYHITLPKSRDTVALPHDSLTLPQSWGSLTPLIPRLSTPDQRPQTRNPQTNVKGGKLISRLLITVSDLKSGLGLSRPQTNPLLTKVSLVV